MALSAAACLPASAQTAAQLGILDLANANGGINPATGLAWAIGDTYRLAFVTSQATTAESADIEYYNDFVQGVSDISTTYPLLGNGVWNIIGSTDAVDARDNTGTNPGSGTGVAVFLLDGVTKVADNNGDLWDNSIDNNIRLDENGALLVKDIFSDGVFTGSFPNGTAVPLSGTGDNPLGGLGGQGVQSGTNDGSTSGQWMRVWKFPATAQRSVYAMSEPLRVIDSSDVTIPTLTSIVDSVGGTVNVPLPIVYTITFNEAMSGGSVDLSDFDTNGTADVTLESISITADPAVYELTASTNGPGTVQLFIKAGASIVDLNNNALDTTSPILDDTVITVNQDLTAPTLTSIVDSVGGGSVFEGESLSYTVTFSEAMDASTITTSDFANGASAGITVDSVSATGDPAVYTVEVTAVSAGDLILEIPVGAILTDLAGNALDTGSALPDDTTIVVNAPTLDGELGILKQFTNGGINPATSLPWAEGDTYRLVFVSSTTVDSAGYFDMQVYHDNITAFANNAGLAGSWFTIGTTGDTNGRDNTLTTGTGVSIFATDGLTKIADNYNDFWDGSLDNPINIMENGQVQPSTFNVATGMFPNGNSEGTLNRALGGSSPAGSEGDTIRRITHGRSDVTDGRWARVFNGPAANQWRFYGMSDVLTVQAIGGGGSAYDTWADSNGLTGEPGFENGQGDDPDGGGGNNLYEFGLGGTPLDGNDDGSLLNAFSGDVAGDTAEEGILTILVRSGATFTDGAPAVSDPVDGIVYTVSAEGTLPVAGSTTVTSTTPVTDGLPPAPAGYEYASFYIDGPEGYFQVTVASAP